LTASRSGPPAAVFTADRITPLLETNPLAPAVAECRLFELDMLADRVPRLRAMLVDLRAQYLSPNGGHD
jgi:hypothetical protein